MKNSIFFLVVSLLFLLHSCANDSCREEFTFVRFDPIFYDDNLLEGGVVLETPKEMKRTGNIALYNDMLFVNEPYNGIHIYNNTDPVSPSPLGFLRIPGNVDLAIKNGILYADSFKDLLEIDIRDIHNPVVSNEIKDVFELSINTLNERFIIGYEETQERISRDCNFSDISWIEIDNSIFVSQNNLNQSIVNSSQNSVLSDQIQSAVMGSFSRFAIISDHLYSVDGFTMSSVDLVDFEKVSEQNTGLDTETLFAYQDHLFIGATTGMSIYNTNNPDLPQFLSEFNHALSCDPVFVSDDIAYVTLRSGNSCAGFQNELDVLDVENLTDPILLARFNMDNPHGLSVHENTLFLAEGDFGLKIFDISNLNAINQNLIAHITDINAFDVIYLPSSKAIMVVGNDGINQFNASDPSNLSHLSFIPVSQS